MTFFFLECPTRNAELQDPNKFKRAMVDYKKNTYENYNEAEVEYEKNFDNFKLREGLI